MGCLTSLIALTFIGLIATEVNRVLGLILFIIYVGYSLTYANIKKCPYCNSWLNIEINQKWTYCAECYNPIEIKDRKILKLEEKLPLIVNYTIRLLFIMEYTNLEFPINNNKRNEIYNFIIKNFRLTTKQCTELKNICQKTLINENWGTVTNKEEQSTNLKNLCNYIKEDTLKVYDNSILDSIIYKLFKSKENQFSSNLTHKVSYDILMHNICNSIIKALTGEISKTITINPEGKEININEYKLDLLKLIIKIIKWSDGNISDVKSYFVKLYIKEFNISLDEFVSISKNKEQSQQNSYYKNITLDESYKLLKINKNSSKEDITDSYNHLMKVYDVSRTDLPNELKKDFHDKRDKIKIAYELIMNTSF